MKVNSKNFINISDPYEMLKTQKCEQWEECGNIIQEWKKRSFIIGFIVGSLIVAVFNTLINLC